MTPGASTRTRFPEGIQQDGREQRVTRPTSLEGAARRLCHFQTGLKRPADLALTAAYWAFHVSGPTT